MAIVRDPVCGMTVDTDAAPATSEYKGQTYYFCAPGCKKQFERDPERYLRNHKAAAKPNDPTC